MRVPVVFLVLAACVVGTVAEAGSCAPTGRRGLGLTTSARRIVETADGYVLSAGSWSETTGKDITIFKVKLDGAISWARSFDIEGSQSAISMDAVPAGGFVVLAWTFGAERESRILRMDDRGDLLWQRGYADETLFGFNRIRASPDGGFVVGGRTLTSEPGRTRLTFAKLDDRGSLVWRADLPLGGELIELLHLREGGYAAVTTHQTPENDLDVLVIRLGEDGSVERVTTYGSQGRELASSAIQTSDGDLVVAGTITPTLRRDARVLPSAWVMRVRPGGAIVWQNGYLGEWFRYASTIREDANGGLVVAGRTHLFGKPWVLKLNGDGSVARWLPHPKPDGGGLLQASVLCRGPDHLLLAGLDGNDHGPLLAVAPQVEAAATPLNACRLTLEPLSAAPHSWETAIREWSQRSVPLEQLDCRPCEASSARAAVSRRQPRGVAFRGPDKPRGVTIGGRGRTGFVLPEVQGGWIGRATHCTPPEPLQIDPRPPAVAPDRVAVSDIPLPRRVPGVESSPGQRTFDLTLQAVGKSHLVWYRIADVVFVAGPLTGVGSYRVSSGGLRQAAWKLDTSLDWPGRSQGLYYLVRYADGGSWQTSEDRTPARDTTLP